MKRRIRNKVRIEYERKDKEGHRIKKIRTRSKMKKENRRKER